jgi:hypothetical protein
LSWAVRPRWLLPALLVVAAALFAVGVAAERSDDHHDEPAAAAEPGSHEESEGNEGADHDEAADASESTEQREAEAAGGNADEEAEEGETLLGVNVESTAMVVLAVAVSVVLAVAVWWRRDRWLLWAVGVFALVFAVFDVAELVHQIRERRTGIAVIAAAIALLHLAAAVIAETTASRRTVPS